MGLTRVIDSSIASSPLGLPEMWTIDHYDSLRSHWSQLPQLICFCRGHARRSQAQAFLESGPNNYTVWFLEPEVHNGGLARRFGDFTDQRQCQIGPGINCVRLENS